MRYIERARMRVAASIVKPYLPELCADLVTALARLDVHDFSVCGGKSQSGECPARARDID